MGRLIDEDIVIDIINFECGKWTGLSKTIEKEIKALPSAQPSNGACWGCQCEKVEKLQPERKKGKWIPVTKIYKVTEDQFPKTHIEWVDATEPDEIDAVRCSECGEVFDFQDARNWCTECGTDMR